MRINYFKEIRSHRTADRSTYNEFNDFDDKYLQSNNHLQCCISFISEIYPFCHQDRKATTAATRT